MTESGPTYRGSIHRDGHIVKVVLNAKFQCMKEVNLLKFQIAETNLTHWIKNNAAKYQVAFRCFYRI